MKATGIVRRIDELGRIVIPKEIRKSHRLNEGDPIEFYLEQGKIVLRKQNEMADYYHQIEIMCDTLQAMTSCKVLFIEDTWLQHHDGSLTVVFLFFYPFSLKMYTQSVFYGLFLCQIFCNLL